jgi:putative addiction module component (TIGR02574 family)
VPRYGEQVEHDELGDDWVDELDRRLAAVEAEEVPTVSWETVKERLLAKYSGV